MIFIELRVSINFVVSNRNLGFDLYLLNSAHIKYVIYGRISGAPHFSVSDSQEHGKSKICQSYFDISNGKTRI